jgi:hypothetical protein
MLNFLSELFDISKYFKSKFRNREHMLSGAKTPLPHLGSYISIA